MSIKYDVVDDILSAHWAPEQTAATIQAGYEQILQQLQQNRCYRLLDDHQLIHDSWADQVDWVAYDWYPRARQAGLQAHILVYSTHFFARRATELALERIHGGLITGFESYDSAHTALRFI